LRSFPHIMPVDSMNSAQLLVRFGFLALYDAFGGAVPQGPINKSCSLVPRYSWAMAAARLNRHDLGVSQSPGMCERTAFRCRSRTGLVFRQHCSSWMYIWCQAWYGYADRCWAALKHSVVTQATRLLRIIPVSRGSCNVLGSTGLLQRRLLVASRANSRMFPS
jgi:hypothetical protein